MGRVLRWRTHKVVDANKGLTIRPVVPLQTTGVGFVLPFTDIVVLPLRISRIVGVVMQSFRASTNLLAVRAIVVKHEYALQVWKRETRMEES